MHLDLIPASAKQLVDASMRVDRALVLGYWDPLFTTPVSEILKGVDDALADVSVPCAAVHGSELDPSYRSWILERLPQIAICEWANGSHFPHLVDPERFTDLLLSYVDEDPLRHEQVFYPVEDPGEGANNQ